MFLVVFVCVSEKENRRKNVCVYVRVRGRERKREGVRMFVGMYEEKD